MKKVLSILLFLFMLINCNRSHNVQSQNEQHNLNDTTEITSKYYAMEDIQEFA